MEFKICKKCEQKKSLIKFQRHLKFYKKKNKEEYYYYPICLDCNKDKTVIQNKNYRITHKTEKSILDKEYQVNNRYEISQKKREYYLINKSKFIERNIRNEKIRRQIDPIFRLRKSVSACIKKAINKKGKSFTKYIEYTIQELKEHLEKQFESWMNWSNQGIYKIKEWDDNDSSTWKWNLDHIIPQSDLPYNSMEDDNFKKCWALENLRPLSAKINVIDGTNRVRHAK